MSTRDPAARAALVLLSLLVVACGDDDPASDGGETTAAETSATDGADGVSTGEPPFDEAEVIEQAGQYATALVQINDTPFASQHGLAASVNVFVDAANAELYRTLDPAAPADLDFPEGALIVKEHLDADGNQAGYLMMYQGPDGYAPEANDWFWARVDASGATQETGAVGFCISCHAQAPAHIIGVETDNRR
jgi:Cytochrome P460